jgi:hypothetical protein
MNVSHKDLKVRVWPSAERTARFQEDSSNCGLWKERSIEVVPGKNQFPTLVLQAYGANLPLALTIEDAPTSTLAAFLADRALIQVRLLEDGRQKCQARYLIRKTNAAYIDVELPVPLAALSRFPERPVFMIGTHTLQPETLDATEKVIRLKLHSELIALPAILEISYTIPVEGTERNTFWTTTLQSPVFRTEVVISQMRWQLTTAKPLLAASLSRSVQPDVQWSLHRWLLTPEASVTSADLDTWLTSKESPQSAAAVTYSFASLDLQPQTIYHLPAWGWLLGGSGFLLIVGLGGYFSPLPRPLFSLLLLGLSVAVMILFLIFPALLPPLLFGAQPGIVLFLVFVGIHWALQERYRRQLVFPQGFSRAKPNSTKVRTKGAKRPREASTVDAPPGSVLPADPTVTKPA